MFEFVGTLWFLISAVVVAFYFYLKYNVYNYWKQQGVPHAPPSIPFGNVPVSYFFASTSMGNLIRRSYEKLCQYPFYGMYFCYKPVLVINDPELIKTILVKEFNKFSDRGWFHDEKIDPMSANLFFLPHERWRPLRMKLSPTFTPGKLRQVYPLMTEVSDEMIKACDAELENSDILEMKDILARYTTDVISSTIYGFNCNSLKNPNSEFRHYGLKAFEFGRITLLLAIFLPEIPKSVILPFYHTAVSNFFRNIFDETVNYRRNEKIVRKDFLNILMQLMEKASVESDEKSSASHDDEPLSMAEAAAQAFVFFIAGFETSSLTTTYCLLELAMNPDVQKKLQQEIDKVAESPDGFNYDNISQMEYLDMVFNETLRKYAAVSFLNRICEEDFPIPGSNYTIPKGMRILITALGVHNNPEYFPNPSKFDPTRFSKENLATRSPYVHIGFGEGPRNCIGKRLGILQAKQAIVALLHNYSFYICDKTILPLKFDTEAFVEKPVHDVHLRFEKRHQ